MGQEISENQAAVAGKLGRADGIHGLFRERQEDDIHDKSGGGSTQDNAEDNKDQGGVDERERACEAIVPGTDAQYEVVEEACSRLVLNTERVGENF